MLVKLPSALNELGGYINRFVEVVGRDRWSKRLDQLDIDQRKSFFSWKIVADYHWLEMAIGFQADVLEKEGRLLPELIDRLILAALNFAATTVEVYSQLSPAGKLVLEGRLRDAIKAETGFASLYLEIDLAQRLMDDDYDVQFPDMEGTARFDLLFSRGTFAAEVECKSLSVDAGRQIHRKDFYRLMETIAPILTKYTDLKRQELVIVSLASRLPSNTAHQTRLFQATASILQDGSPSIVEGPDFRLERRPCAEFLARAPFSDQKALFRACCAEFGPNIHVSGGVSEDSGCLVVMRSEREDDTSKPMLGAMRKAAEQFSAQRPAFIAIQEHGIEAADLMLPHVRRRAAVLSCALFEHYGAAHVNATYVTGFGAAVLRHGYVGTPAFAIPNMNPRFPISAANAAPFLVHLSDQDYAAAIGAPLPAPNISFLPFDPKYDNDRDLP
ncbi:MAG: hypothetical protein KKD02_12045 [Alphaproteobacteria bacterium]|nr:hypothetical protein [Alphaproteobacteria bacterium]